jgi:crotonobetainyl-CoA:carnitine CoA-transferase CaiB-like acyl-CoA transferase
VTSASPLTGVTVVELGHSVAAPYAGAILAQLGGRVVKVEQPGAGDPTRDWGPPYSGDTAVIFQALNRDKQGVAVDLKDPGERAALERFILDEADVVIQNLRPGSIERIGLAADDLLPAKPSLIYCSLSAFGAGGPLQAKPGYDPLMQAYGGLMSITGEPGRPPVRVGTSIIDMGAGMWSAMAILAALHERGRTGLGGVIDTSLYETALAWMTLPLATYLASGEVPQAWGSAAPQIVPYQVFATADGYLMVAAGNDNLFNRLAQMLGRPEWCVDERYCANGRRVANREPLVAEIAAILIQEPAAHWVERLDAAGVPNARLQPVDAVADDPQTLALGMVQPSKDGTLVGLPMSFDGVRPPLRHAAPALGADNGVLMGREAVPS